MMMVVVVVLPTLPFVLLDLLQVSFMNCQPSLQPLLIFPQLMKQQMRPVLLQSVKWWPG
jgi:hypothetical protein